MPDPAPKPRLPLYLYGHNATQVSADGPALLVRVIHKAPMRYPYIRLARIICGPGVEWQARALAACRHQGLPIIFLDQDGEPTGYLQPMQGKPSRLDTAIEETLDRADWETHYHHWLRARRMELVEDWHRRQQASGHEIDPDDYRELIREHVYQADAPHLTRGPQAAALTAFSLDALHHAGLKPRYWGLHGAPLELATDLTSLLGLALHLQMRGLGHALHGDNASLLRVLHSYGPYLYALLPHLLGSLHRRLKSLLEEWL